MPQPEIAILVSSFERPGHLRRVLDSIAAQRGVEGAFEVVVTDDGSRDETLRLVQQFADSVSFPVHFTTHPHDGFQLSRCRNEGVRTSTAPYLLFVDGDCLLPPDHLRVHLDHSRTSYALASYPIYLDQAFSERISKDDVQQGSYLARVPAIKHWKLRLRHLKAAFYSAIGDATRPKFIGSNLGIARADYERVNGYDENFHGWGCEDDDLRLRLRAAGIRVASIAWWTNTYHLWHPKTPSAPPTWRAGTNVAYFQRPLRLTRCLAGLVKRKLQDLRVEIVGRRPSSETLARLLPLWCCVAVSTRRPSLEPPDLEIAFEAGGLFSQRCNCRVLIVPEGQPASRNLIRQANLIFADQNLLAGPDERSFPLSDLDAIIQRQLGFEVPPRRANPITPRELLVRSIAG